MLFQLDQLGILTKILHIETVTKKDSGSKVNTRTLCLAVMVTETMAVVTAVSSVDNPFDMILVETLVTQILKFHPIFKSGSSALLQII